MTAIPPSSFITRDLCNVFYISYYLLEIALIKSLVVKPHQCIYVRSLWHPAQTTFDKIIQIQNNGYTFMFLRGFREL